MRFLSQPSLSIGLFTLWLAGACLLLGREAASHLRVAKARDQWTPATANMRERLSWPKDLPLFVDDEFGPCALGVFDSIVVIPARLLEDLSLTAARQMARHELDHLKWRDPFVHAAMRIVRASFWFSAPLWYLDRATRLEREAASDRAAVNSTSRRLKPEIAAVEYAETLVSIARRCARVEGGRKRAWVVTEIGNESGLNDRVRRLMAISSRVTSIRLSFAFVTLLVTASVLVVLPVARLESKPNENGDEKRPQPAVRANNPVTSRIEPAKEHAKPATLKNRLLSEIQDGVQESKLAKTVPETMGQDSGSARPHCGDLSN